MIVCVVVVPACLYGWYVCVGYCWFIVELCVFPGCLFVVVIVVGGGGGVVCVGVMVGVIVGVVVGKWLLVGGVAVDVVVREFCWCCLFVGWCCRWCDLWCGGW